MLDINNVFGWQTKTPQYSEVVVGGVGGYGSVATKWRYFPTVYKNIGNAITYSGVGNGLVNGDFFVINQPGFYAISYFEQYNSQDWAGVTVNSNSPTTNVSSLTLETVVGLIVTPGAQQTGCISQTVFLNRGDVVRAHTNGTAPFAGATNQIIFRICKVSYN